MERCTRTFRASGEVRTSSWWVWNSGATKLFNKIDSDLWKKTEGNPVLLLQTISYNRMEEIMADKEFMDEMNKVYAKFQSYMEEKPKLTKPSVAYFSMEYGLAKVLKI